MTSWPRGRWCCSNNPGLANSLWGCRVSIRSVLALATALIVLGNSAFADTVVLENGRKYSGRVTGRERLRANPMQENLVGMLLEPSWADETPEYVPDGVRFTFIGQANTVSLAGDFNSWSLTADTLTKKADGSWTITKRLESGTYRYAYAVNGVTLQADASDPRVAISPTGGRCLSVRVSRGVTGGSMIELLMGEREPCVLKYDLASYPQKRYGVPASWDYRDLRRTKTIYGRIAACSQDSVEIQTCPQAVRIQRQSVISVEPLRARAQHDKVKAGFLGFCWLALGVFEVVSAERQEASGIPGLSKAESTSKTLGVLAGTAFVGCALMSWAMPGRAERELNRLNSGDCK